jgi:hypothetical protein
VDQNFNSFIQAVFPNLDSFAMDPSIPLKITEFILFIASIHDFFNVMFSWCFVTRIGVLGENQEAQPGFLSSCSTK